jgi:hypothetical protein
VFCISFFFYFFYIDFQCVQFAFEMLAVLVNPGGDLIELSEAGLAKPLTALLSDDEEAAVKEDLDVQGYGLTGHVEFFRDGVYVMGLGGDHVDDGSPGGVCYGLVYVASGFHFMVGARYLCKQVLANIRASICLRKFIFGWGPKSARAI